MKVKELIELSANSKSIKYPLDIQYFAEGDMGEDAEGEDNDEDKKIDDEGDKPKLVSETDVIGIVQRRLAKERKKWEEERQQEQTEAEKLKKMSDVQKAEYKSQKKERELAQRETEVTKKELMTQAKETLIGKGIPVDMADFLDFTDAEKCNESIARLESSFNKSLQNAVEDKIKGGTTMKKASTDTGVLYTKEELESMTPAEINADWSNVQESMKTLK